MTSALEFLSLSKEDFRKHPVSSPLKALWHDARDNWEIAHQLVQDEDTPEAAWVHAYLHRKEGDNVNARYWYSRAGKRPHKGSLETEREEIAKSLFGSPSKK
jgi:hypothetical protein